MSEEWLHDLFPISSPYNGLPQTVLSSADILSNDTRAFARKKTAGEFDRFKPSPRNGRRTPHAVRCSTVLLQIVRQADSATRDQPAQIRFSAAIIEKLR